MCGPKVFYEVIDLSYLIDDEDTPEDQVGMEEQLENAPGLAPTDETTVDETDDEAPGTPTVDQEIDESTSNIYDFLFLVEAKRNFLICWELNRIVRETAAKNRANHLILMAEHDMMMMEEERRMEQANNDLLDFLATLPRDYEINHTYSAPGCTHQFTGSETTEDSTYGIW